METVRKIHGLPSTVSLRLNKLVDDRGPRERMIRKIKKNSGACKGFTLIELLTTLLIISIMFTGVMGGIFVVRKNYYDVVQKSEADMMLSTAANKISKDLRTARISEFDDSGIPEKFIFYQPGANVLSNTMHYENTDNINQKQDESGAEEGKKCKGVFFHVGTVREPLLTENEQTKDAYIHIDSIKKENGYIEVVISARKKEQSSSGNNTDGEGDVIATQTLDFYIYNP